MSVLVNKELLMCQLEQYQVEVRQQVDCVMESFYAKVNQLLGDHLTNSEASGESIQPNTDTDQSRDDPLPGGQNSAGLVEVKKEEECDCEDCENGWVCLVVKHEDSETNGDELNNEVKVEGGQGSEDQSDQSEYLTSTSLHSHLSHHHSHH